MASCVHILPPEYSLPSVGYGMQGLVRLSGAVVCLLAAPPVQLPS